jgi:hypothetical protein
MVQYMTTGQYLRNWIPGSKFSLSRVETRIFNYENMLFMLGWTIMILFFLL